MVDESEWAVSSADERWGKMKAHWRSSVFYESFLMERWDRRQIGVLWKGKGEQGSRDHVEEFCCDNEQWNKEMGR